MARLITSIGLICALAGCAGTGPYRSARSDILDYSAGAVCQSLYTDTDKLIQKEATDFQDDDTGRQSLLLQIKKMIDKVEHEKGEARECWQSAHEPHRTGKYDLYYAEFDDAGRPTDRAKNQIGYPQSQLHLIESSIKNALDSKPDEGLDLVVFTHGWHGNAKASNNYSTEFKAILMDIAAAEESYRGRVRTSSQSTAHSRMNHKVVGIEIAWRGDSLLTPPLIPFDTSTENVLNVWDRKVTAEEVSTGAVQELLAFLNEQYLDNSCHGIRINTNIKPGACDRVHLLSIGHSFGALINYRALAPRLESGLNVGSCHRVYGFGDMTILLNPAFEGARYRGLFENGVNRPALYGPYRGPLSPVECPDAGTYPSAWTQIPSIVTLQSAGDTATGTFFPLFRHVTTPLEQTLSAQEATDKTHSVGWIQEFRTHALTLTPMQEGNAEDQCSKNAPSFCPFDTASQQDLEHAGLSGKRQGLTLTWQPGRPDLPAYMPLWSVLVDPNIMKNHDDFWNPQIVRFISLLFADAYEQSEQLHGH